MSTSPRDKKIGCIIIILYLLLIFLIPLYWIICNMLYGSDIPWDLRSNTLKQAKERDTFICSYVVTESRILSGNNEEGEVPKINECFCELMPARPYLDKKLYSDEVEYNDSIVYTTIILDDSKQWYVISNTSDGENYVEGFRPQYTKRTDCPIPDSLSIIISRDSVPLVSYSLRRN